jgi:hypothetical protein
MEVEEGEMRVSALFEVVRDAGEKEDVQKRLATLAPAFTLQSVR